MRAGAVGTELGSGVAGAVDDGDRNLPSFGGAELQRGGGGFGGEREGDVFLLEDILSAGGGANRA